MIDLCTNIKFNIEDLEKYGPPKSKVIEKVHHAHLQIEENKEIVLKVYYDEDTYLADKVLRWNSRNKEQSLTSNIEFTKLNETRLTGIDISSSVVVGAKMSIGPNLFDPGLGKYFTIKLDKVILEYENLHPNTYNEAYIGLGHKIKPIIEDLYFYDIFADKDKNKWKALSRKVKFRKFKETEYNLKFAFGHKKNSESDESIIKKHPQLVLRFGELKIREVIDYIDNFGLILSFFNNANCYPANYTIYNQKKEYKYFEILKDINNHKASTITRNLQNKIDVFGFIRKCKPLNRDSLNNLIRIVDRFNLASSIKGEARFMIFYEIFERIKNHYSKINSQVKTEYDFSVTRKEKIELIKELAGQFQKLVPKAQQDEIYNRFIQRVSSIKYLSVKNQYLSLLKNVKLDKEIWLPLIKQANEYRDDLFHGGTIDVEEKTFKDCTNNLKTLNVLLIGRMLGVNLKAKV